MAENNNKSSGKLYTKELVRYDFDHPIRLVSFRTGGLDTLFYAVMLSICLSGILLILSIRNGKVHFEFTLGRTLISFPLSVFAVIFYQLLRELRKYPPLLLKQNIWTIDELMELTGKDRRETEQIITRVLEACFTVSPECILNVDAMPADHAEAPDPAEVSDPTAEEPSVSSSFSKYDD